jgi:hypothetical protein
MAQPWLRVGIVVGGKLVDEQVWKKSARVRIGGRRLFSARGESWWLHREGGVLPLPLHARGRVTVGEMVVLFQVLAAPPERPRPRLPPSVRSSPLRSVDARLLAILIASFALHFGCVGYLRTIDFPRHADLESVPQSLPTISARFVPPRKPDVPAAPAKLAAGARPHHAVAAPAESSAARRARLAAAVSDKGVLSVILSKNADGKDGLVDRLLHGDAPADADEVFARVGGVGLEQASTRTLPRSQAAGSIVASGSIVAAAPSAVLTGDRDRERLIDVKESAPTEIDGEAPPDSAAIAREVRARLGAIRACYERALRHEALGGKLRLRFEVSALGRVTAISVEDDTLHAPQVVSCIRERGLTWRLAPARAAFSFSYPFIFVAR